MLKRVKKLYGYKLNASDGDIGIIEDFYFDDQSWNIRYLVAETRTWLIGRQVLISPYSIHRLDKEDQILIVDLTRKQIEDSPPIERHRPVSRQFETEYYTYYGWPYYWTGETIRVNEEEHLRDDTHLRSALEVAGYEIEATDGTVGHVSDLVVDDGEWAIKEIVVQTGHWYAGKEIRIPVDQIKSVNYFDSKVHVSLTKGDIEHTGENHVAYAHH